MTFRKSIISLLIVLFTTSMLNGCAGYATTGKMMDRLEKKATAGMSEQEFTKAIPIARLVEAQGSKKVYLVAIGEPCFVCGSGEAFVRSFEPYATRFTFTDGTLSATERVVSGQ